MSTVARNVWSHYAYRIKHNFIFLTLTSMDMTMIYVQSHNNIFQIKELENNFRLWRRYNTLSNMPLFLMERAISERRIVTIANKIKSRLIFLRLYKTSVNGHMAIWHMGGVKHNLFLLLLQIFIRCGIWSEPNGLVLSLWNEWNVVCYLIFIILKL